MRPPRWALFIGFGLFLALSATRAGFDARNRILDLLAGSVGAATAPPQHVTTSSPGANSLPVGVVTMPDFLPRPVEDEFRRHRREVAFAGFLLLIAFGIELFRAYEIAKYAPQLRRKPTPDES